MSYAITIFKKINYYFFLEKIKRAIPPTRKKTPNNIPIDVFISLAPIAAPKILVLIFANTNNPMEI